MDSRHGSFTAFSVRSTDFRGRSTRSTAASQLSLFAPTCLWQLDSDLAQLDAVLLVPHLAADLFVFAFRAASSLCDDRTGVGEPKSTWWHDPWFDQHYRILDRHFVEHLIPGPGELLYGPHLIGVKEAAAPQPRFVGESDGVENECVAFPASDGVPHVRVLQRPL